MNELDLLDKVGETACLIGHLGSLVERLDAATPTRNTFAPTVGLSDIMLRAGKIEEWALTQIKERASTLPPSIEAAVGKIAQDLSSMLPDPLDWSVEETRKRVRAVVVEVFDAYAKRIAELEAELAEIKDG